MHEQLNVVKLRVCREFRHLTHLLKTDHQNEDAWFQVSANLTFAINYDSGIPYLEKMYRGKGLHFFACAKFIGV
jgi:hypothetical protein